MSFGMWEAAASSEVEAGLVKQAAVDQMTAAVYDVREKLGPFLFQAASIEEFRDRVAMTKNDQSVYKIIGAHLTPVTGIVRRIVGKNGELEREFKAILATGELEDRTTVTDRQKDKIEKGEKADSDDVDTNSGDGSDADGDDDSKDRDKTYPDSPTRDVTAADADPSINALTTPGTADAITGYHPPPMEEKVGPWTSTAGKQDYLKNMGWQSSDADDDSAPSQHLPPTSDAGKKKKKASRRRADFDGTMDNNSTFSPSDSELVPDGNFDSYLNSVDQNGGKVQDRNFTSSMDFQIYADWCEANRRHPLKLASLDAYATNLPDMAYLRLAREIQAWEFEHQPKTPKGQSKTKLKDVTAGQHSDWDDPDSTGMAGMGLKSAPELEPNYNYEESGDYRDLAPLKMKQVRGQPGPPRHQASRDPLQHYIAWCKHNGYKRLSARNVDIYSAGNPQLCTHLALRMKNAIHVARVRQAGEHRVEDFTGHDSPVGVNPYTGDTESGAFLGTPGGQGHWDSKHLNNYGERFQGSRRQAGEDDDGDADDGFGGKKAPPFGSKDSHRRTAAPDYLQKADDALTQLLNQKAEEFQQTIAPLQQALVTVQQAEQLQQQANPLNVLPPAGTVNVMPGQSAPGQIGQPDPSGGQDPQAAAAAALAGAGADPSAAGLGADPTAGTPDDQGGPPPAAAGGGLPPELDPAAQQMQARRRRAGADWPEDEEPFWDDMHAGPDPTSPVGARPHGPSNGPGGYPGRKRGAPERSLVTGQPFGKKKPSERSLLTGQPFDEEEQGGTPPWQDMSGVKRGGRGKGRARQGRDLTAAGVMDLWNKFQQSKGQSGNIGLGGDYDYEQFQQQYGIGDQALNKLKTHHQTGVTAGKVRGAAEAPNIAEEAVKGQWRQMDSAMTAHGYKFDKVQNHWAKPGHVPIRNHWQHTGAGPLPRQAGVHDYDPNNPDQEFAPARGHGWEHASGPSGKPYVRPQSSDPHRHEARELYDHFRDWPHDKLKGYHQHLTSTEYGGGEDQHTISALESEMARRHSLLAKKGPGISGPDSFGYYWDEQGHEHDPDEFKDAPKPGRVKRKPQKAGSRRQAWVGWGPSMFPKAREVTGWNWDDHLNGYLANKPQHFACECGSQFPTPGGFQRCACGRQWNSYVIGTGGNSHEASADKFIVREVPVRPDVIVANRQMTGMRKGAPFAGYEDFDDCTSQNSDKDRPDAYCGEIKHRTEDKKARRKRAKTPTMLNDKWQQTDQGWAHPDGGMVKPSTEAQGKFQLWGPTVTMKGRGGQLAPLKQPHEDPHHLMNWYSWASGEGPKPPGTSFFGAVDPNWSPPRDWDQKFINRANESQHAQEQPGYQPYTWDDFDHDMDAQGIATRPKHGMVQLLDPRTGNMHTLIDPGEITDEGEDPGTSTMKTPPADWARRGDGARWQKSPIGA